MSLWAFSGLFHQCCCWHVEETYSPKYVMDHEELVKGHNKRARTIRLCKALECSHVDCLSLRIGELPLLTLKSGSGL